MSKKPPSCRDPWNRRAFHRRGFQLAIGIDDADMPTALRHQQAAIGQKGLAPGRVDSRRDHIDPEGLFLALDHSIGGIGHRGAAGLASSPLRMRRKASMRPIWASSSRPLKAGMSLPETPLRMTWRSAASEFSASRLGANRLGPRPPARSLPWQPAQLAAKSWAHHSSRRWRPPARPGAPAARRCRLLCQHTADDGQKAKRHQTDRSPHHEIVPHAGNNKRAPLRIKASDAR